MDSIDFVPVKPKINQPNVSVKAPPKYLERENNIPVEKKINTLDMNAQKTKEESTAVVKKNGTPQWLVIVFAVVIVMLIMIIVYYVIKYNNLLMSTNQDKPTDSQMQFIPSQVMRMMQMQKDSPQQREQKEAPKKKASKEEMDSILQQLESKEFENADQYTQPEVAIISLQMGAGKSVAPKQSANIQEIPENEDTDVYEEDKNLKKEIENLIMDDDDDNYQQDKENEELMDGLHRSISE